MDGGAESFLVRRLSCNPLKVSAKTYSVFWASKENVVQRMGPTIAIKSIKFQAEECAGLPWNEKKSDGRVCLHQDPSRLEVPAKIGFCFLSSSNLPNLFRFGN